MDNEWADSLSATDMVEISLSSEIPDMKPSSKPKASDIISINRPKPKPTRRESANQVESKMENNFHFKEFDGEILPHIIRHLSDCKDLLSCLRFVAVGPSKKS